MFFINSRWDTQKQRLTIDFHANTTVKGHYKADGRILILPITGDGIMKLKLSKLIDIIIIITLIIGIYPPLVYP